LSALENVDSPMMLSVRCQKMNFCQQFKGKTRDIPLKNPHHDKKHSITFMLRQTSQFEVE